MTGNFDMRLSPETAVLSNSLAGYGRGIGRRSAYSVEASLCVFGEDFFATQESPRHGKGVFQQDRPLPVSEVTELLTAKRPFVDELGAATSIGKFRTRIILVVSFLAAIRCLEFGIILNGRRN